MLLRLIKRLPLSYYPYKKFMHQHKCIFIHIPKNAGTSILHLLQDKGGRKHAKWAEFYESNDYFFKRYHKFCIVREPLERLYSAYSYAIGGGNNSTADLALASLIKNNSDCFTGFIEHVLDVNFVMLHILFQPQYLFIYDPQLKCIADTVLRYESLDTDWRRLAKQLGLPPVLPWENKIIDKPLLGSVSQPAAKKVVELYQMDYQLLGYSLPSLEHN